MGPNHFTLKEGGGPVKDIDRQSSWPQDGGS
jgi:hypothetical protein